MKKAKRHRIREVLPDSIAQEMEVEAGDVLLSINGEEVADVFDYRFLIQEEELVLLIEKPDGEQWELEIEKEEEEDLGIVFENDLMSEYVSCSNHCIFCFIDQMPPGMRETLYFKDDDSRLSFLQGNYITLTNMKEKDIDRIIRFHLAPINISIHTTNPELRCRMLHNRFAGKSLGYLKKLYDHQIEMNGQIVLCKGVNDGPELERTMDDLEQYLPFMRSVSVVPAGMTKYRDHLYPLDSFDRSDACRVIDQIERRQKKCMEKSGLHFFHASDEFYLMAGREVPEEPRYDGYIQLENGVGMMRLLKEEFQAALEMERKCWNADNSVRCPVYIATGELAAPLLEQLAQDAGKQFPWLKIRVLPIRNDFFGPSITVSGLITGRDLTAQVQNALEEEVSDGIRPGILLIPANMLRAGEQVFLDDMTVAQVKEQLGLEVKPVGAPGEELLHAMLDPEYHLTHMEDHYVYIQAYPSDPAE